MMQIGGVAKKYNTEKKKVKNLSAEDGETSHVREVEVIRFSFYSKYIMSARESENTRQK